MMFTSLIINGRRYSKQWLLKHFRNLPGGDFSENSKQALQFCGAWLSGQERFAITTSGSTGFPKTIELTREQMALSARLTAQRLSLTAGESALVCLPVKYIAGMMMLVRGLEIPLQLTVIEPSQNPMDSFREKLPPFDFTALVPSQLHAILNCGEHGFAWLNRFKVVLLGGAPVSYSLQKNVQSLSGAVYETFGMTETASHIALRRLNGETDGDHFEVLPGVEISTDSRGCLTICSPLSAGQTLVTNDRVELISDTRFVWQGRADNVINSGGVKIQAEKVEGVLAKVLFELNPKMAGHPDFFVAGLPDETYGEVVAVLFEQRLPEVALPELRRSLGTRLHKYEVPKRFLVAQEFVRTHSGKIQRRKTLARWLQNSRDA